MLLDQLTDLLCDYRLVTTILISHGYSEALRSDRYVCRTGDRGVVLAIRLFCLRFNDQRWIAALVSLLCAVGAVASLAPGQRII